MTKKFKGLKTVEQTITDFIKPLSKKQGNKLNAINLISKNWSNIIGDKYAKYCKIMSISSKDNDFKLSIISHNSSMTFFLRNNIDIIIDKIRCNHSINIKDISIINQPQDFSHDNDNKIIPSNIIDKVEAEISDICDEGLKDTLRKLGHKLLN